MATIVVLTLAGWTDFMSMNLARRGRLKGGQYEISCSEITIFRRRSAMPLMNPAEAAEAKIMLWYFKYRFKPNMVLTNKPTSDMKTQG